MEEHNFYEVCLLIGLILFSLLLLKDNYYIPSISTACLFIIGFGMGKLGVLNK